MNRLVFLFLILISEVCLAQNEKDNIAYVYVKDSSGAVKKVKVVRPSEILIVEGDSIYMVPDEFQLRKILEQKESFDIVNNPDSMQSILTQKIKSVIIIKRNPD